MGWGQRGRYFARLRVAVLSVSSVRAEAGVDLARWSLIWQVTALRNALKAYRGRVRGAFAHSDFKELHEFWGECTAD